MCVCCVDVDTFSRSSLLDNIILYVCHFSRLFYYYIPFIYYYMYFHRTFTSRTHTKRWVFNWAEIFVHFERWNRGVCMYNENKREAFTKNSGSSVQLANESQCMMAWKTKPEQKEEEKIHKARQIARLGINIV